MKTIIVWMMLLCASVVLAQEVQTPAQKAATLNQKYAVCGECGGADGDWGSNKKKGE
jgi:cytochrome c553